MSVQTTQGLASSLGYGLGRGVRFFMRDQNPTLRWLKRSVFFVLVAVLVAQAVTWFISALLSVTCLALIIWALSKSEVVNYTQACDDPVEDDEGHPQQEQVDAIWRDGPEGWGYYSVDDVRIDF